MKTEKISRKTRVIICVSIIIIVSIILMGMLFYKRGTELVITRAQNEAMRIAQNAAGDVDGDVFDSIKSEGEPAFNAVYDALSSYKIKESLKFIYAMKKLDGKLVFIVDTDEEDPADFLEPYEWLDSMEPAFNGEVCSDYEFTSDEWGTYISGYAPVFDSKNRVVGIVGCDIEKDTILGRIILLRNIIIAAVVVFNLIMVASLAILGRKNTRR